MEYLSQLIKKYVIKYKLNLIFACLFFLLTSLLSLIPAKLTQVIIDEGFINKNLRYLFVSIIALALVYISKSVFSYISSKYLINLGNGLLNVIKSNIYQHLMHFDIGFYTKHEVGYINARLEEISKIDILFSTQMLTVLSSIVEFLFAFILLITINWKMTTIMLIPVPFLLVAMIKAAKGLNDGIDKTLDSSAEYSGKITETLRGIETVKSMGYEEEASKKVESYNNKALDNSKQQMHTFNKFNSGVSGLTNMLNVFIYLVGGLFFYQGKLSIGEFMAISAYIGRLYAPIFVVGANLSIMQPAYLALKRISDFIFSKYMDDDEENKESIASFEKIEFRNLSFNYPNSENLISDFNGVIYAGDKIQITGKNGSGKSTLLRLLLKFYDVNENSILINNTDINILKKEELLSLIAYVPQKNYVFNDSIRNNITYGLDNFDETYLNYLLNEFGLNKIEDKLMSEGDFNIGENGAKLSGGEIQKICLIRALLLNKEIYILDEAAENLDKNAYAALKKIILNSKSTWIIVDHKNEYNQLGFKILSLDKKEELHEC